MGQKMFPKKANDGKNQFDRRRFLQATTAAVATSAIVGKSGAVTMAEATPEMWSDPETWGGSTPSAGEEVIIEPGKHVVLDQHTPNLGGVTVRGVLEFKDGGYRELTSDYVLAEGDGIIRIGTEDDPFQSKAVITLTGSETDESIRAETGWLSARNFSGRSTEAVSTFTVHLERRPTGHSSGRLLPQATGASNSKTRLTGKQVTRSSSHRVGRIRKKPSDARSTQSMETL